MTSQRDMPASPPSQDERLLETMGEEVGHLKDLPLATPAHTLDGAMAQSRPVATLLAQGDSAEQERQRLHLALVTLASLRRR